MGPRSGGRHPNRRLTPNPLTGKINRKSGDPEAPLTDELLNETLFRSLPHARAVLEVWRRDYNEERPHSKLG
jgi:transposase InsO family protein